MGDTVIAPYKLSRYKIPAKNGIEKHVEVDLGQKKPQDFSVIVKTMALPADHDNVKIKWFAIFGIRHKKPELNVNGFAPITYTVTFDAAEFEGKRLFVYYGGEVHEVTNHQTSGGRISFTLPDGDPGIGYGP